MQLLGCGSILLYFNIFMLTDPQQEFLEQFHIDFIDNRRNRRFHELPMVENHLTTCQCATQFDSHIARRRSQHHLRQQKADNRISVAQDEPFESILIDWIHEVRDQTAIRQDLCSPLHRSLLARLDACLPWENHQFTFRLFEYNLSCFGITPKVEFSRCLDATNIPDGSGVTAHDDELANF